MIKGKIDSETNIEDKFFKKPAYIDLVDLMTKKKLKDFIEKVESRRDLLNELLKYGKKKLK